MEIILIILALALYFLLGYLVCMHRFYKKLREAINYELELSTSDYQKGWLDCLGFILKQ